MTDSKNSLASFRASHSWAFFSTTLALLSTLMLNTLVVLAQPVKTASKAIDAQIRNREVFHRRGGLPNIFYKIDTQQEVKIAYLGGSITGAQNGWRDLTFNWFRLTYPNTVFHQANYAVGGTGSVLGVFRLDDLLNEKPDLLFVEFAVNDENEMSIDRRILAMEGIVRKTWQALPNTDICFVYTTALRFCDTLMLTGKRMEAVIDHEKIASHYGIPSIDMGLDVVRLALAGKLILSANPLEHPHANVFLKKGDDYHPIESGHIVYAGSVIRELQKMNKKSLPKPHTLLMPYRPDNWQESHLLTPAQTEHKGNWEKFSDEQKDKLAGPVPSLYKGKPGAISRFRFEGNELGIYDIIGPGTGIIDVTIDGQLQEVKRFNHNCSFWHRHNIFLNKLPQGVHTVEIKVTNKELEKKLVMKPDDDPAKYANYDWYPIGILITGKLLNK
ncbi:SGNH/GDSL hydrolase family protein [Runella sp. MFBS21]|uniref:SGNH/GDSL hydrolase family protein n=1 Tax=Runella sp. MFBS21 TaxID=3034018 RepID=UPI0023F713C1|nr:SGNH/GDSL hydrolase family protein [Runella sp. MFBS21]MDF7822048.1 SGNH/GDSL hydrolase family protein [Runella sp. MFBS21]